MDEADLAGAGFRGAADGAVRTPRGGDAYGLRRAWEDRQGSGTPFVQHGDQPESDKIAGKGAAPADASDGAGDHRPK